jgi:hypothetical protein
MSSTLDRMREELIRALHIAQRRRERDIDDMAEASRRGRLLESEPSFPDVPLHKRGFGVMDEDAP